MALKKSPAVLVPLPAWKIPVPAQILLFHLVCVAYFLTAYDENHLFVFINSFSVVLITLYDKIFESSNFLE